MLKSMTTRLEQFAKFLPAFVQQEEVEYLSEFVLQELEREKSGEGDDEEDGDIGSFVDDSVSLDHIINIFPRFWKALEWGRYPGDMAKVGFGGLLSKHKERSLQLIAPSMADIPNVRCLDKFD